MCFRTIQHRKGAVMRGNIRSVELRDMLKAWLKANGKKATDLWRETDYKFSAPTWGTWVRDGYVSRDTVEYFLMWYAIPDPESWLQYFDKQTAAA